MEEQLKGESKHKDDSILTTEYNVKNFLLPDSMLSMAAVHAKIYPDRQQYQLRISDCNNAIKLWGDVKSVEDLSDGIKKLNNLITNAVNLRDELSHQMVVYLNKNKEE